ncbi:protein O-linked-mannose beta-1,2-N-acetylglucosaminyltransferase 1 isoform X1 [Ixodes scapularis]|uniref:protein O-linked-mannose beta-1,2-N-acetylglucosaminyltransferase 1 isoform X1 n=1 Tax=Ixodes scapularis TaxID=6945 RepID=UPI001C393494|nr:protein O-linked-mannose beta-1,2-N-acetylglucosaminyltransferase 1 isoform X1 [Ixodes scapularis]XP_042147795.1 protein O-linked-mannose beta-1,2-N-acetylglucosaminyltransferase 1 isoform X1 [Ixodes scapularis]
MCVSFKLSGRTIHPDPRPQENLKRRQFCMKYQHFPSFCSGDIIDNPLVPNPSMKFTNSKIFTTPVIVMSGEVIHHLPLTLETLIMQPGIDPRHVLVFHVPEHPEVRDLCELFGFTAEQLDNSNLAKSCDQFTEAFDTAERQFPDAVHFVVIEEGVILAPDFLAYLAQLLPLLDLDSTISSISAWNDNGFEGISGKSRRVYRVESLTGLAFLVRRGFPAQGWCERRFEQRPEGSPSGGDSLSPDASRVVRLSDMPLEVEASLEVFESLVARGRVTDMELGVTLEDIDKLERSRYERLLHDLLSTSLTWALNREFLATCNMRTRLPRPPASATTERHAVSLYFDQNSPDDIESLRSLCSCFGLFHHPKFYPRGLYRGMLRFTWEDYDVFLIGRYSPYYKFKPKNISPLSLERAVSG